MNTRQFLKNFFKRYTEQSIPVNHDLWPTIQCRLQQLEEENGALSTQDPNEAGRDESSNRVQARLFEAIQKFAQPIHTRSKEFNMDPEKRSSSHVFARRTFLKASTAATGAAVVTMAAQKAPVLKSLVVEDQARSAAQAEDQLFSGACRGNCASGCFLNIHVRDGKVVQTSMRAMPNPAYNRICVKGLTHIQRIYHPDRLKYPMKRVGERGSGQWERITWDEAITTITDKWKQYEQESGKESFAISWGSGSYGTLSGQGMGCPTNRLLNVAGCANIQSTVDAAHGYVAGFTTGWGANFTFNEIADLKNARTILCWGANPVISQPHSMHFIMEAMEEGTKFVVIDPIRNITATKADEYVPIRPGSDGALAFGMMNIIVREHWIDEPFLKKTTVAPFLVKESDGQYLRLSDLKTLADGETDAIVVRDADGKVGLPADIADPLIEGTFEIEGHKVTTAYSLLLERIAEYPPERAAKLCNLPVEQIEGLARLYANNKPSTIYTYFGVDHYVNGHYSLFAIYALAMITGNMGKAGAACGMGETLGINFVNIMGTLYPEGATGPSITLPITEMNAVMEEHRWGTKDLDLKGAYFTHVNVLGNAAQRQATLDWMKKLDFIAVADLNMNETARYADILLPAAHWFEVKDVFCNYSTHPYVLMQEKAIDPPYECKSDFEITKLLAEKMGLGQYFDMDEDQYLDLWMDTDAARSLGITRENLEKQKAVKCLPGENFVFAEDGVYGTATGRAQFYQENPAPNSNYDARFYNKTFDVAKERLPSWEPPHEAWFENPLHEKYPFVIISEHVKFRTHTQWWDVPTLLELDPEPILKINSADAAQYGIHTGDSVKIYNDRGFVVMKAAIHEGIQPGVLMAPKGWEKQQFIDGHFQDLPSHEMNVICANSAFFDVLVGIEKV